MLICDTHSDTLYSMGVQHRRESELMITPEKLRLGGVSLQVFALWTGLKGDQGDWEGIVRSELSQIPAMTSAGIKQVDSPLEVREGEHCFMLSIEGCEMFGKSVESVAEYRAKGVRMGALVWNNPNAIGFPAKGGSRQGLTDWGVKIVKEMQRLGMAVDTSHLNEQGFYDIFSKTDLPPLASHSCCRRLCDHFRNLTDEQLRLMIREGGYVGVNFYPSFLSNDGKADIKRVAEHIDYICQMGGEGIVGFGSDFDGIECTPTGLEDPTGLPALLHELEERGYSQTAIEGIAGRNLIDYYKRIDR